MDYVAVDGANLEVGAGEFVTIIGRSGSGSPLCWQCWSLDPPERGQVTVDGQNILAFSERELAAFRSRQSASYFSFPACSLISARSIT